MPSCTVCGHAVEWVRSTYSSAWRLFRDRPDVLTRGEYIRCPIGTPHFQTLHNLGSRNWRRGTDEIEPTLGEPLDQRQNWTRSEPLSVFPLSLLIGSGDCIAGGDTYASRVAPSAVFNGFLAGCWLAIDTDSPRRLSDITLSQRTSLVAQANILNLLYTDQAAASAAAIALLGPNTVVTLAGDNLTAATPVTLIATNGNVTLVFVAGSTNYQQYALQAMFSLIPPAFQAGYGTNPVWQAASTIIAQRIIDSGVSLNTEIRFIGHSYGGAAATLTAAQAKRFSPGRTIELLTFGMPKPGDQRLVDLLVSIPSMNIVNVGDPIPSLPPAANWLFPFIPTTELEILQGWADYRNPPNMFRLEADGSLTPTNEASFTVLQLGELVLDALTSTPPAAFNAHGMDAYWTAISLPQ